MTTTTDDNERPAMLITWAVALALSIASLAGILVLSSDLAATDAVLTEAVGQIRKIADGTHRGVTANEALPPTNAAVLESMPAVLATVSSLQSANDTLTTLGNQIQTLADVLARAADPVRRTVDIAGEANHTVRLAQRPTGRIVDTLGSVDHRVANLGPLLDQTLNTSRSIESKLRILLVLPGK